MSTPRDGNSGREWVPATRTGDGAGGVASDGVTYAGVAAPLVDLNPTNALPLACSVELTAELHTVGR